MNQLSENIHIFKSKGKIIPFKSLLIILQWFKKKNIIT